MADERRRRRRGPKRGRGKGNGPERPEDRQEETPQEPEGPEEDDESPSEGGSRFRLPFRRRSSETEDEGRERRGEEPRSGSRPRVSPLGFWRRGSARAYREEPMPKQTLGRTMRRLRQMYFPPWVPVLAVIVVVFGILGMLFFVRGATGAPRINEDHWHATYSVFICGEKQPNFPEWNAGVHTHADGIIHIHPFTPSEEGAGARLVKWFEYGGGKLTQSEMRMPGDRDEYKNGDTCPDGSEAMLQVFVNGEKLGSWDRYIPQDGDQVRIVFGPEEETAPLEDRTVIAETEATRTINLSVTDGGNPRADTTISPDTLEVTTGETVKIVVAVSGSTSHGLRVAGADGEYETQDDFVSEPEIIDADQEGFAVVRFDEAGTYEFQDPLFSQATGSIVVSGADRAAEIEISGGEGDAAFSPDTVQLEPGESLRLVVKNVGSISHAVRAAGPDGEYDTEDDIVSDPEIIQPGEEGVLQVQFEAEGEYAFEDPSAPAASGAFVVAPGAEEEGDETSEDEVEADVTLDVTMTDEGFKPAKIEVEAGQTFRINLPNQGSFVHNMRIAGPDGEFETDDDIVSTPQDPKAGEDGTLVGTLDEPGTYEFRSDFQPTEITGTLTVK